MIYLIDVHLFSFRFFKEHFKGRTVANGISPNELMELLQSKDYNTCMDTGTNVISEEDLNKLLDRSDLQDWKNKSKQKVTNENQAEKQGESSSCGEVFKVIGTEQTVDVNF